MDYACVHIVEPAPAGDKSSLFRRPGLARDRKASGSAHAKASFNGYTMQRGMIPRMWGTVQFCGGKWSCGATQRLFDLLRELLQVERFVHQWRARFQHTLIAEGLLGVAGHVQDGGFDAARV
jgi:hypothetical protein